MKLLTLRVAPSIMNEVSVARVGRARARDGAGRARACAPVRARARRAARARAGPRTSLGCI
jgi:hypothetical protein